MLRAGKKSILQVQNLRLGKVLKNNKRQYSQDPYNHTPKKWYQCGMNQIYMAAGGSVLLLCGSTVAYAKYDDSGEFRRKVERNVPGSSAVFNMILGSSNKLDVLDKPLVRGKYKPGSSGSVKISDDSYMISRDREPIINEQGSVQLSCQKDEASRSARQSFADSSILSMKNPKHLQPVANEIDPQEIASKLNTEQPPTSVELQKVSNEIDSQAVTNKIESQENSKEFQTQEASNNVEPQPVANTLNNSQLAEEVDSCEEVQQLKEAQAITEDQKVEFDVSSAILDALLTSSSIACANAIVLNHAAAKALAIHSSLLRTALDDTQADPYEKSLQWSDVALSLNEKEKKMKEADSCYDKAREEMTKLKQAMESMDVGNRLIKEKVCEMEENCIGLSNDLNDSMRQVSNQRVAAKALNDYQTSIENTKSSLRMEMELPEGKRVEEWKRQGVQLSCRDDIDALRHLHEQKEVLKEKLSEERMVSASKLQEAVDQVRADTIAKLRREYVEETERMLGEERKVHQIAITEAQSEHESTMQRELKKQALNHAEHLAETLTYLDTQARDKYEAALKREIETQREEFQKDLEEEKLKFELEARALRDQQQMELNTAHARLQGIKSAIDGRAHTEHQVRKALELSLACESLLVSLKYGDQGNPLPLKNHVDTIQDVYGEHPAIDALSSSLPVEVRMRGAYPEDTIRRKLHDTMQICKRVSLVDEKRNSLFVYFLSYLKSFLLVSRPTTKPPEQLELSDLDCFSAISYANYCLQRGDIEQAVRFLNQLKGEARMRAERWLQEARLYLETKQSVDALCAISDSIVIGAQLEK